MARPLRKPLRPVTLLQALVSAVLALPGGPGSLHAQEAARVAAAAPTPEPDLQQRLQLSLLVSDPQVTAASIAEIARTFGAEPGQQTERLVVIRIAPDKLDEFRAVLAKLGTLRMHRTDTRLSASERAEIEARLRSAEATRKRLLSLLADGPSVDDALLVEKRVANVDTQIARLQARLMALDRQTQLVRVCVRLVRTEPPVPQRLSSPELPFDWLQQLSLSSLLDPDSHAPSRARSSSRIESNLDMALQLEGRMLLDSPHSSKRQYSAVGALRSRGIVGADPVGIALGTEVGLGGGQGFVYELGLLLGLGTSVGELSSIGLLAGVGGSGWTGGRVPSALELPVELYATVELGQAARLVLYGQPRWTPGSDSREDGSAHLRAADELSLGSALVLAPLLGHEKLEDGGVRIGFVYRELLDTRMYLVTAGLGIGVTE